MMSARPPASTCGWTRLRETESVCGDDRGKLGHDARPVLDAEPDVVGRDGFLDRDGPAVVPARQEPLTADAFVEVVRGIHQIRDHRARSRVLPRTAPVKESLARRCPRALPPR